MGIRCRFCSTRINPWKARTEAAFYFLAGDGDEPRITCTSEACREKAGVELREDERRAA